MKSKYFTEYSLSENVKKDIGVLSDLSDKTLDTLASWFEGQSSYPRRDSLDVKALSKETGEGAETIQKALNAADILIRRLGEYEDAAEDILTDIVTLKILPQSSSSLLAFLKRLAAKSKSYYLMSRIARVAAGGMPNLTGSGMTVAVKPVFDKDFQYGTDDITKYVPALVNNVVVAHISLERSDCPQEFAFQITKDNLDRFINELLVLQKQMIIAEETLKITNSKE